MKHILRNILVVTAFGLFLFPSISEAKTNVYFFWGEGCPHCAKEEKYFEELATRRDDFVVHDFEIYHNQENVALLKKVATALNMQVSGVPITIIGETHLTGFGETTTPAQIESLLDTCAGNTCPDPIAEILGITSATTVEIPASNSNSSGETFNIPMLGKIDPHTISLPLITVILGGLDGFNPCAMWALVFLISMLLGMQNRKKMWILGSAFIVTSAVVYFFFMAAWLNLILFLGLIMWLRLAVGGLALFAGGYHLKKFFSSNGNTCEISTGKHQTIFFEKVKNIVHTKSFWFALAGIVALAFAVNLIELFCSAGLPVIYTQILALNNLSSLQYYLYISLYIFFFMLDDLFVFFVAMTTLHLTGVTTKYNRAIQLISAILMLAIGALMILRPDLLMFG